VTRLIINGDDFGASTGINRSIVRACQEGILTSCSLMVGEEGFHEAVGMARDTDGLAVGLHLVAVKGKSVLSPLQIPSLVDGERNFPTDPVKAGLHYYLSKKAREDLALELRAQFERFLETGLRLSHVDSHLHLHLHPVLFESALELCREFGVRHMRVPDDDPSMVKGFQGRLSRGQMGTSLLFGFFTRRMKATLKGRGMVFPEQVFGNLMTGRMSKAYVMYLLDHLPAGDYELYLHPDRAEGVTAAGSQRQREFSILMDPDVKARIIERQIGLIHYEHLAATP
jgi:hopanoid biosynthesis associated protein HpnK